MTLTHIKEILEKTFEIFSISEERTILLDLWKKELGRHENEAELIDLKKGRLLVAENNHVLLHELTMRRNEILKNINSILKKEKIKEIRFKLTDKKS